MSCHVIVSRLRGKSDIKCFSMVLISCQKLITSTVDIINILCCYFALLIIAATLVNA